MHNFIRWNILCSVAVCIAALAVLLLWPKETAQYAGPSVAASAVCADITPKISLIAQSAYAKDLQTGRTLYAKNPDVQLPLASLTKLATALTAFTIISPDDTITISKEALEPEGSAGLRIGEEWKAGALLDYTLLVSANDGIRAIALAAAEKQHESLSGFIAEMNQKIRSLGMRDTYFASDTGLDTSSSTASAYGSARDVATLIAEIVTTYPRLLEDTSQESETFTSLSGYVHTAKNTSPTIGSLSGAVASKTGYTDLAGGNLAIVFEPIPGRPVAVVVLGSTREGRDTDMQLLATGVKTALKRMIVCGDGAGSP